MEVATAIAALAFDSGAKCAEKANRRMINSRNDKPMTHGAWIVRDLMSESFHRENVWDGLRFFDRVVVNRSKRLGVATPAAADEPTHTPLMDLNRLRHQNEDLRPNVCPVQTRRRRNLLRG